MSSRKGIRFSDIQRLFPPDKWDVGYLSEEELRICAQYPVKVKSQKYGADFTNNIHFIGTVNSIVLSRYSPDSWDYTLYMEADEILKKSGLRNWFPIYTNFKMAAILAGLGVRAKNSLVYGYKFGFDMKLCVIGFEDPIIDPPEKKIDTGYWKHCEGCSDCRLACPAGAIHNEQEPYWLDSSKCDNFIGFGEHPRIPSIKKFWHKHVHPEVPEEIVRSITSCIDAGGGLPFDANGYTIDPVMGVLKDGRPVPVPFCRECTVQPRCSKWKGQFPYESVGMK